MTQTFEHGPFDGYDLTPFAKKGDEKLQPNDARRRRLERALGATSSTRVMGDFFPPMNVEMTSAQGAELEAVLQAHIDTYFT
jgi:hypothetical protein